MSDLREGYKQGLILGISFCLFALPVLIQGEKDKEEQSDEEVDGYDEVDMGGANDIILSRIVDGLLDIAEQYPTPEPE